MKVITWTGLIVEKPKEIRHQPAINRTVKPVQTIPFSLWGECLRASIMGERVKDVTLVTEYHL